MIVEKLKTDIPNVETVVVDLSNWNATKLALKSVLPIDLLVNNAGLAITGPFLETTEADYDKYLTAVQILIVL